MRIGVDGRELEFNTRTGIGRYLINFLSYATAQRPDYRFFLYGNENTVSPVSRPNLTNRAISETMTFWWDQVLLPQVLQEDKIDVFLSPYIKGPYRANCPYVVTIHDLIPLKVPEYRGWNRAIYNFAFRCWGGFLAKHAAAVITDSIHSKRDIVEILRIDPARIQVCPIGLSSSFEPVSDAARMEAVLAKHGISTPYLLYVGNFKPHKNLPRLLQAFQRVLKRTESACRIILVGKDEQHRGSLETVIQQLGLGSSVTFAGLVEDDDLPALYSCAQVVLLPSLYEGFGLPALEAMACGAPVVVSRSSSLPEIVGDAGVLVDPRNVEEIAQAICDLLSKNDLRKKLGARGLERSQQFSPGATSGKVLDVLENHAGR